MEANATVKNKIFKTIHAMKSEITDDELFLSNGVNNETIKLGKWPEKDFNRNDDPGIRLEFHDAAWENYDLHSEIKIEDSTQQSLTSGYDRNTADPPSLQDSGKLICEQCS